MSDRSDGPIILGNNGADAAGEYRAVLAAESASVHLTSAGLIR